MVSRSNMYYSMVARTFRNNTWSWNQQFNPCIIGYRCYCDIIQRNLRQKTIVTLKYIIKKPRFDRPGLLYLQIYVFDVFNFYIIPGIPPPIGGIPPPADSSLMSVKAHSVVKIIPDTEAAFSNATLVTFLGSIIPALSISTY